MERAVKENLLPVRVGRKPLKKITYMDLVTLCSHPDLIPPGYGPILHPALTHKAQTQTFPSAGAVGGLPATLMAFTPLVVHSHVHGSKHISMEVSFYFLHGSKTYMEVKSMEVFSLPLILPWK